MLTKFLKEQPGWNSKIAVPFRLLEELPDYLENVGLNTWAGAKKTYDFKLHLKPSRFDILVRNSMTQFVEHHTIQVNGIPDLSPWSLVDKLISRLDKSRKAGEVFIGDIVSELPLIRSSSALVSSAFEFFPSPKALAAMDFVSQTSGLKSDAELRLTLPFQLWSEDYSGERPVWTGYRLPSALSEFAPTMVTSFDQVRLVGLNPASVPFRHEPEESDCAGDNPLLCDAELDELDCFTAVIREALTNVEQ